MKPTSESATLPGLAAVVAEARRERRKKRRMFCVGLGVRVLGLALIWLGDGGSSVFRKAVVVLGLILSIGGIAVLRFLLISGFRKRK